MADLKQDYITLVNKLPVSPELRQELLKKTESKGVDAVKKDIGLVLEICAGKLPKQDIEAQMVEAEKQFDADLKQIEAEAKHLARAVGKNQDEQNLASVRNQINR